HTHTHTQHNTYLNPYCNPNPNPCLCDPGWGGQHCDHCVPMPGCVHGSCQQPWQCSCDEGWAGRFCDKDLSVCSQQHPCQNGASCVMEDNGDYTCLCPEGFHGRHCQLKAGPCHKKRSPCKNGGQCDDDNGFAAELMCRCLAGFMGPRCETNVDDCLMKPCGNGATCLDGVNRFSCLCPAGFTGLPSRSSTSKVLLDATATASIPAIWSPEDKSTATINTKKKIKK
uniref:Delta like non-canonical Notch ligand 2 n=1 Tax=Cynoglossus semilaevis TaxID=244447 RepID=A0A3P8V1F7_CYNSE